MEQFITFVAVAVVLFTFATGDDPCDTTFEVPDIITRLPHVTEDHGDDRYLTVRWYKVENGIQMAKSFPAGQRGCGARDQCWMNGDMPSEADGETDVDVCVASVYYTTDNCRYTIPIKVKNCGLYSVYYLTSVAVLAPDARYCFQIVADEGEADGAAPTFRPSNLQIRTEMMLHDSINYEIKFLCDFTTQPNTHYSVFFRVDGIMITSKIKTVQDSSDAFILESELTDINTAYTMGITISCNVGAKFSAKGNVGPRVNSADFFAGLKIEGSRVVQLARGERSTIKLRPTVPVGCSHVSCTIDVYLADLPGYDCHTNAVTNYHKCSIGIQGGVSPNFFDTKQWDQTYDFVIETVDDQIVSYDLQNTHFRLHFRMSTTRHHKFWNGLSQSVTVNVYDKEEDATIWKDKKCTMYCDPHMKTFDGMKYEMQEEAGEYLAFKHSTLPIQVEVRSSSCDINNRSPYCICGVAVVVGKAVFVLDTCSSAPTAKFLNCGGRDELLVVEHDTKLEFHLPTGALVTATRAYRKFWNVVITPTVHEVNKTSGLCGSLDGDLCNDCLHRDGSTPCTQEPPGTNCAGSYSYHPNDFTSSYRLDDDKSLFGDNTYNIIQELEEYPISSQLCFCPYDDKGNLDREPTTSYPNSTCGYRKFSSCNQTKHDVPCSVHATVQKGRKKRSLATLPNDDPPMYPKTIRERSTMTESDARRLCEAAMQESPTLSDCSTMGLDTSDEEIEYCILDLMATGNMVWVTDAMDRASQSCLQDVTKNSTVRVTYPESAVLVQNLTCLHNCSSQGSCSNGECTCNSGFAAVDCSVNLSVPPTVNDLDLGEDFICDQQYNCDEIGINGGDFPSDRTYTCRLTMFQVDRNDSRTYAGRSEVTGLQRNIFQVVCPLDISGRNELAVALEYSVAVRMDENDFSTGLQFVVLNSICQDYTVANGKYTYYIKTGYCFIEGECFTIGHTKAVNCQRCEPGIDPYFWSAVSDIAGCIVADDGQTETALSPDDNSVYIAVIVMCSIVIVAVITVAIAVSVKSRHANPIRVDNSRNPLVDNVELRAIPGENQKHQSPGDVQHMPGGQ